MRRIFSLILTLFVGVLLMSSSATAQKPHIVFEKLSHDFGTFKESDGVQTTKFAFINKGSDPLILNSVRASAADVTARWTTDPIPSEGKGYVEVDFNPVNNQGTFSKSIMITSNAQNGTMLLKISGVVTERDKTLSELYPREIGSLRAKYNHISFARMTDSETKSETLELVNTGDKPVKVGFRTVPDFITASVDQETVKPHSKAILTVTLDAAKANTYGFFSRQIYLSLDGSSDYRAAVGISATIEEDFSHLTPDQLASAPSASFIETSYDFGKIKEGQKVEHTFMLQNNGKSDLLIRNIRASCGCTAVAPSQKVISPGTSAPVNVTFDSRGKRGRQNNSVTVITNDPKVPSLILQITAEVSSD